MACRQQCTCTSTLCLKITRTKKKKKKKMKLNHAKLKQMPRSLSLPFTYLARCVVCSVLRILVDSFPITLNILSGVMQLTSLPLCNSTDFLPSADLFKLLQMYSNAYTFFFDRKTIQAAKRDRRRIALSRMEITGELSPDHTDSASCLLCKTKSTVTYASWLLAINE